METDQSQSNTINFLGLCCAISFGVSGTGIGLRCSNQYFVRTRITHKYNNTSIAINHLQFTLSVSPLSHSSSSQSRLFCCVFLSAPVCALGFYETGEVRTPGSNYCLLSERVCVVLQSFTDTRVNRKEPSEA